MPASNQCIVVLGMHRSGTSALTGALSLLGIHPGERLIPAIESVNPKGFWEHAEIVSIHNQLLAAFNSSWLGDEPLPDQWWESPTVAPYRDRIVSILQRDFSNRAVWLIKDPRMCHLLPLWRDIFHELNCQPMFVIALRPPSEVAHSLRKRDNIIEAESCLLWLSHMLEAEYQTRGQRRIFVSYERLLSDWRSIVTDIGQALAITWPVTIMKAAPAIEAFLDGTLRHHNDNDTPPGHPICRLARKSFELLSAPSPDPAELDQLRAQTDELVHLIAPWSKRSHGSERQIRNLEDQNQELHLDVARIELENAARLAEIRRLKSSVSWQITAPLRVTWNIMRKLWKSLGRLCANRK